MKKILSLFVLLVLLVGCSKDQFVEFKDEYIDEQGIIKVEDIITYNEKPYIEGLIFKGIINDNEENIYFCEGLPGKNDGIFSNGEYTASLLAVEEQVTYHFYDGDDLGYDESYFVGIAFFKITDLYYKGKSIDFQTKDIILNDEKISLTVWLMPYSNGEEINISDFEYDE